MNKRNKLLIASFAMLAVALLIGFSFASDSSDAEVNDSHEVKIGDVGYATLEDAISAANENDVITLLKDVEVSGSVFNKAVKITSDPVSKKKLTITGTNVPIASGIVFENVKFYGITDSNLFMFSGDIDASFIDCEFDGRCSSSVILMNYLQIESYSGRLVIDGCKFNQDAVNCNRSIRIVAEPGADVLIKDCEFIGGDSEDASTPVKVSGEFSVEDLNISGNKVDGKDVGLNTVCPTSSEPYVVVGEVTDVDARIGNVYYETYLDALLGAVDGDRIEVLRDTEVTVPQNFVYEKSVTVSSDAEDKKTISMDGYDFVPAKDISFENLKVVVDGSDNLFYLEGGIKVSFIGCEFSGKSTTPNGMNYIQAGINVNKRFTGTLIVRDCVFDNTDDSVNRSIRVLCDGGSVTVSDSVFITKENHPSEDALTPVKVDWRDRTEPTISISENVMKVGDSDPVDVVTVTVVGTSYTYCALNGIVDAEVRIGDLYYPSFEAALIAAGSDDDIVLIKDIEVSKSVLSSKAFSLVGDGEKKLIIEDTMVALKSGTSFEDVVFLTTGDDTVFDLAGSGEYVFDGCVFFGGVKDSGEDGTNYILADNFSGKLIVTDCEFDDTKEYLNRPIRIIVSDAKAEVTVKDCTFLTNDVPQRDTATPVKISGDYAVDKLTISGNKLNDVDVGSYVVVDVKGNEYVAINGCVNAVAKVGDVYFEVLDAAIESAGEDDTIVLLSDVAIPALIRVERSLSFDLGEFRILRNDGTVFYVTGDEELTLSVKADEAGGAVADQHIVYSDNPKSTIRIDGGEYIGGVSVVYIDIEGGSVLFIEDAKLESTGHAVVLYNISEAYITDSEIFAEFGAVWVGNNGVDKLAIEGCTIRAIDVGLYLGTVTSAEIVDCDIAAGNTGVEIKSGAVAIEDSVIKSGGWVVDAGINHNGSGVAVAPIVINNAYYSVKEKPTLVSIDFLTEVSNTSEDAGVLIVVNDGSCDIRIGWDNVSVGEKYFLCADGHETSVVYNSIPVICDEGELVAAGAAGGIYLLGNDIEITSDFRFTKGFTLLYDNHVLLADMGVSFLFQLDVSVQDGLVAEGVSSGFYFGEITFTVSGVESGSEAYVVFNGEEIEAEDGVYSIVVTELSDLIVGSVIVPVSGEDSVVIESSSEEALVKVDDIAASEKDIVEIKAAGSDVGPEWEMSIPADVFDGLDGTVSVKIADVDTSKLSNDVRSKVGDGKVFSIEMSNDGVPISDLGQPVTVKIAYTLGTGERAYDIHLWYIDVSGDLKEVSDVRYEAGYVVFTTDHFSDWVLDFEDVPSATSLLAVLLAVLVSTIVIVAIVKRIE